MGAVIVASIAADQIDAVQHKEFAHSLLQDPEVVFLRGLVRIEGCNEALDKTVVAGDQPQLEGQDIGRQNSAIEIEGGVGNAKDRPKRAAGQLNEETSIEARKKQGGSDRESPSSTTHARRHSVAKATSLNPDTTAGSRMTGSAKAPAPAPDIFAGAFEAKPAWERRFTAIRNTVGTVARTLGATYLTTALELG